MKKLLVLPLLLLAGCLDNILSPTTQNIATNNTAGPSPSPSPLACAVDQVTIDGANTIPVGSTRFFTADLARLLAGRPEGLSEACGAGKTYLWLTGGPCRLLGAQGQRVEVIGDAAGTCLLKVTVQPDGKVSQEFPASVQP